MKKEKDKRIHVTYDDETREILEILANKQKRSLSEMVRKITEEWLDRDEDARWIALIEQEELESGSERLSHEEIKKLVYN